METKKFMDAYNKEKAFTATPIGAAFVKFKNANARAWQLDTEDACFDRQRKSTQEAWAKARDAEREFRELLNKMVTDIRTYANE